MYRLCALGALLIVGCHYDSRGVCPSDSCVTVCADGDCDVETLAPGTFASPLTACAPADDATGGSQDYPFCDVASAVAAAAARDLHWVYVDAGTKDAPFVVAQTLTMQGTITIEGSRSRSSGWTRLGDYAAIDLATTDDDVHLEVAPAARLTLSAVTVFRSGACPGDCATVHGTNAAVTLSQATIGRSDGGPAAQAFEHAAVWLEGASHLISQGATLIGCAGCGTSTGVKYVGSDVIDPASILTLETTTITNHGAVIAYGVRSLNADSIAVTGGSIDVAASGYRVSGSFAYGIADGDLDELTGGGCIAPCGASNALSLSGATVKVDVSESTIGVAAAATKSVKIDSSTVSALAGEKSIAVATYGIAGGFVTTGATTLSATTSPSRTGGFARGYADNFGFRLALSTLGSSGVVIGSDTKMTAIMTGGLVPSLQGIALACTFAPVIHGKAHVETTVGYPTAVSQIATGIALENTTNALIEGAEIVVGTEANPISASTTLAGITDGRLNATTKVVESQSDRSTNLEVSGTAITMNATHADVAAGVLLAGSSLPKIHDVSAKAKLVSLNIESANYVVGVQTLKCASPAIDGLHIVAARTVGSAVPSAVTGTLDGSVNVSDTTQASATVTVTRTIVETSFPTTLAAGFTLHGLSGTAATIKGNVAWHKAIGYATGALVLASDANIGFNTFRFDGCTSCGTQNHAVGVYAMINDDHTVNVLANDMIVVSTANAATSIMLLDQPSSASSPLTFGTTDANNYGAITANVLLFTRAPSSNTIPAAFQTATQYDNASFKSSFPTHVVREDNIGQTRAYCASDPIHVDASTGFTTTYGTAGLTDIDGDTRGASSDTTGADVYTMPCP